MNEIQKIFKDEIREKKSMLSGVRGRASRTGRVGKVKFPTDELTEAQWKKLNGEVITYMSIIDLETIKNMPFEKAKEKKLNNYIISLLIKNLWKHGN